MTENDTLRVCSLNDVHGKILTIQSAKGWLMLKECGLSSVLLTSYALPLSSFYVLAKQVGAWSSKYQTAERRYENAGYFGHTI